MTHRIQIPSITVTVPTATSSQDARDQDEVPAETPTVEAANPETNAFASVGVQEKRTRTLQDAFLAAYAVAGTVSAAARAVGITRQAVERWQRVDAHGFLVRFDGARKQFGDSLEDLALARVKLQKPHDSPLLLITLLNANLPDKYRPNQQPTDDRALTLLDELRRMGRQPNTSTTPTSTDDGIRQGRDDTRCGG